MQKVLNLLFSFVLVVLGVGLLVVDKLPTNHLKPVTAESEAVNKAAMYPGQVVDGVSYEVPTDIRPNEFQVKLLRYKQDANFVDQCNTRLGIPCETVADRTVVFGILPDGLHVKGTTARDLTGQDTKASLEREMAGQAVWDSYLVNRTVPLDLLERALQ